MSAQPTAPSPRMTVPGFVALKGQRRISMVTAYDYATARILDSAGLEAIWSATACRWSCKGTRRRCPSRSTR
ncbi:MAG: hypothetical protein QM811_07615 [Pirellulales bacterium]